MNTDAIAHAPAPHCLNCGTAVHGHFCSHCGQETANHMPSAGEFLHEFVGHYVALENKLLKTLALLLFRPGRLTRDYLEGKRARYVLPLRLYLTLSLIFFAVFKWQTHAFDDLPQPTPAVQEQKVVPAGEKALDKIKQKAAQEHPGTVSAIDVGDDDLGWVERHFGKTIKDKVAHFSKLPSDQQWREVKAGLFAYLPYAIFAMMPVFALYLKLLYLGSGRRYGEHLLFALHTNAFAFLVLILMMLTPSFIPFVQPVLWLWLVFYLPAAMRKVYGGSRLATFGRWMVLMTLHMVGMVLAIFGALALVVMH